MDGDARDVLEGRHRREQTAADCSAAAAAAAAAHAVIDAALLIDEAGVVDESAMHGIVRGQARLHRHCAQPALLCASALLVKSQRAQLCSPCSCYFLWRPLHHADAAGHGFPRSIP